MSDASGAHQGLDSVHPDLASQDADHIHHPDRQGHPDHRDHASTVGPDESDHDKSVVPEQGSQGVAAEHPVLASQEHSAQARPDAALTWRPDQDAVAPPAARPADQRDSDVQADATELPDQVRVAKDAAERPDHPVLARSLPGAALALPVSAAGLACSESRALQSLES
jgi:hypothetical protein